MYAFTTGQDIPAVDFEHPEDAFHFFYWRNHFALHHWMADLYSSKGGRDKNFNCAFVRIDAADLATLKRAVAQHGEPIRLGVSISGRRVGDGCFIRHARDALASGKHVYFASWW
jgi:hypothetical protein